MRDEKRMSYQGQGKRQVSWFPGAKKRRKWGENRTTKNEEKKEAKTKISLETGLTAFFFYIQYWGIRFLRNAGSETPDCTTSLPRKLQFSQSSPCKPYLIPTVKKKVIYSSVKLLCCDGLTGRRFEDSATIINKVKETLHSSFHQVNLCARYTTRTLV
jgi:hypothetical protein